jgi:hypothetical protein
MATATAACSRPPPKHPELRALLASARTWITTGATYQYKQPLHLAGALERAEAAAGAVAETQIAWILAPKVFLGILFKAISGDQAADPRWAATDFYVRLAALCIQRMQPRSRYEVICRALVRATRREIAPSVLLRLVPPDTWPTVQCPWATLPGTTGGNRVSMTTIALAIEQLTAAAVATPPATPDASPRKRGRAEERPAGTEAAPKGVPPCKKQKRGDRGSAAGISAGGQSPGGRDSPGAAQGGPGSVGDAAAARDWRGAIMEQFVETKSRDRRAAVATSWARLLRSELVRHMLALNRHNVEVCLGAGVNIFCCTGILPTTGYPHPTNAQCCRESKARQGSEPVADTISCAHFFTFVFETATTIQLGAHWMKEGPPPCTTIHTVLTRTGLLLAWSALPAAAQDQILAYMLMRMSTTCYRPQSATGMLTMSLTFVITLAFWGERIAAHGLTPLDACMSNESALQGALATTCRLRVLDRASSRAAAAAWSTSRPEFRSTGGAAGVGLEQLAAVAVALGVDPRNLGIPVPPDAADDRFMAVFVPAVRYVPGPSPPEAAVASTGGVTLLPIVLPAPTPGATAASGSGPATAGVIVPTAQHFAGHYVAEAAAMRGVSALRDVLGAIQIGEHCHSLPGELITLVLAHYTAEWTGRAATTSEVERVVRRMSSLLPPQRVMRRLHAAVEGRGLPLEHILAAH